MASAESGGPAEQINYFPQNPKYNQPGDPGTWRKMEVYIQNLKQSSPNDKIKLEIRPNFIGNSKRPDSFDVRVTINGKLHELPEKFISIPNPL